MKIEMWAIDRVKPYANNPRRNDPAIAAVAKSLAKFGWRQPIVVDDHGVILVGHTRLLAAQSLGMKEVPVHVAEGLDDQLCRAYRIADNASGELALWDEPKLAVEVGLLRDAQFDMSALAIEDTRLMQLLAPKVEREEDPDEIPAPQDATSRPGDVWILGNHRLACGDCTDRAWVERFLDGVKVDLMVTDPPYGVSYAGGASNQKKRRQIAGDDDAKLYAAAFGISPAPICYTWFAFTEIAAVWSGLAAAGYMPRAVIVWNKIDPHYGAAGADYKQKHEPCMYGVRKGAASKFTGPSNEPTVWDIKQPRANELHPTQKPVECMRRAIRNHADAAVVYEPFSGSGTTIIACEELNRRCLAIEIDPTYLDVAVRRWQNFTGGQATLAGDGRSFTDIFAARPRNIVTPA